MKITHLEKRLAEYAETSGFGRVITVDANNLLSYFLYYDQSMLQKGGYLKQAIETMKNGKALLKPPKEIKIYGKGGVYVPPEHLQKHGISKEDFLKYLGVDINKGLCLVHKSIISSENRLFTQLHETIHARDNVNGFKYFESGSPECQAYEVLTDTRNLMFAPFVFPESCFDFSVPFNQQKIFSSYVALNNQNMHALRNATRGFDPRVDRGEILEKLSVHLDWTHGRGIQDVLLKAPAYSAEFSKDIRREAVRTVLDNLITIEENSRLPSVVPREI